MFDTISNNKSPKIKDPKTNVIQKNNHKTMLGKGVVVACGSKDNSTAVVPTTYTVTQSSLLALKTYAPV